LIGQDGRFEPAVSSARGSRFGRVKLHPGTSPDAKGFRNRPASVLMAPMTRIELAFPDRQSGPFARWGHGQLVNEAGFEPARGACPAGLKVPCRRPAWLPIHGRWLRHPAAPGFVVSMTGTSWLDGSLQALNARSVEWMVHVAGIEPTATRLSGEALTGRTNVHEWCIQMELNHRHRPCRDRALPLSYGCVPPAGFEPAKMPWCKRRALSRLATGANFCCTGQDLNLRDRCLTPA
jgi:hypothetical protein